MNAAWSYFPLESDGQSSNVQNGLPTFQTRYGEPWISGDNWFTGNGTDTGIITAWTDDLSAFDAAALPRNGSYLIGFQLDAGDPSQQEDNAETIFFCGSGRGPNKNAAGLRIAYRINGKVTFHFIDRNLTIASTSTRRPVNNSLSNIFCYCDNRPPGSGVNATRVHVYQNGTDIKLTSSLASLSSLGEIYPANITPDAALAIGCMTHGGIPKIGSYFSGKVRRLHILNFGTDPDEEPGNLAELMGRLSTANMLPDPDISGLIGMAPTTVSRTFVKYV